jgi:hypothetical protein
VTTRKRYAPPHLRSLGKQTLMAGMLLQERMHETEGAYNFDALMGCSCWRFSHCDTPSPSSPRAFQNT